MKRGFSQVQLIASVVVLGLLVALALVLRSYLVGVEKRGYDRGASETTAKWQGRLWDEQMAYDAEADRLRAERDEALGGLQTMLNDAQADFEKERQEHEAQKAKNAQLERDLRAGRIVLRDPGGAAPCEASGGKGAADPAAAAKRDGEAGAESGELSADLSAFLWGEAGRADEAIEDLEARLHLAQDTVRAYYLLAQKCHASH